MKKSILYGLISFGVLSIISIINMDLYVKLTAAIGIASVIISGLFLKVFFRGKEFRVDANSKDEREDRNVGIVIAAFGSPFLIASVGIFIFSYYV